MSIYRGTSDQTFQEIIKDIKSSKGATGYLDLSDGTIIQWGTFTGTGQKSFPKIFPNACFIVMSSGAWNPHSNPAYTTLSGITNWDATGFYGGTFGLMSVGNYGENIMTQSYRSMNGSPNFAGTSRYIAIGY